MSKNLHTGGLNVVVGREGSETKLYDSEGKLIDLKVIDVTIKSGPNEVTTAEIVFVANIFGSEEEMKKELVDGPRAKRQRLLERLREFKNS